MADFSWNNNDDPFDPASFVDKEPPQCFCGKVATTIYPSQEPGPSPTRKPRERDYSPPESFLLNEFDFSTAHTDEDEAGPSFSSYAYQMPSSFRQSSRRAYRPPPEPSSKKPPPSAVVYECHFTTPQEGMVSPEVCADCEDLLRLPNERELDSGFEMFKRLKGQEKEEGERNRDGDDSWPMVWPSGPSDHTEHQDEEDAWTSPVYHSYSSPENNLPHFVSMPSLPSGYTLPEPRKRKVCGFHMHALEWFALQGLSVEGQIALTRTADCPVFNQSLTRWLDCRPNDLELAPFNVIKCFCMEPMVIRLRKSSQGDEYYEYACVYRLPLPLRPESHWSEPDDHLLIGAGCSRVVLLKNASHIPRTTPVHQTIKDTPWRQSILEPPKSINSGRKEGSILKISPHPLDLRRAVMHKDSGEWKPRMTVGFKRLMEEIIPAGEREPEDSATLPAWYDPDLALQMLNNPDPYTPDDWPDKMVEAFNDCGAGQVSDEMLNFMVEEAVENATDFAASVHERMTRDLEVKQEKLTQMERDFEQLEEKQKKLVQEAKVLSDNGKEMQRFRCRVCWDANSTHAVLPCYHLVLCEACTKHMTHCGICRTPIQSTQRIKWG
ncbi:hypothetical protein BG006_009649 [Podila minutissima]|uniref:RING-type domain-containing protein n=1 Tax=Podila minutissima TaxID=64525 RepID=A0A9P5VJ59_9FUNG|nr:hypothetical protein BG006_009649 [Podila minutissima]